MSEVSAAFEVFVCTSTTEDRTIRQNVVQQLLHSMETKNCGCLEAVMHLNALKKYDQWSCCTEEYCNGECFKIDVGPSDQ